MAVFRPCLGVAAVLAVLPFLCSPAPVRAQSGQQQAPNGPALGPSQDSDPVRRVRAVRIASPLRVDGRLDEASYTSVLPITEFIQQEPAAGSPISERTEVWVMFDDQNLYFACRCGDSHPERIVSNEMRRDNQNQRFQDNFSVLLDTFHDRRNGYLFIITPVGGFTDATVTDERAPSFDWNTVWESKTTRFENGWIAEMAIPFKSLRYAPGREQTWGINLRRVIRSKNEFSYVVPMDPAWGTSLGFLRVSAGATLVGLEAPATARNFEIKPYAAARVRTDRVARPSVINDVDGDLGFDVKYGLTRGLTADLTYNTDFAQVEDDEAQVNLTRFALSFPEKREFFLENQGIFSSFGGGSTPAVGGSGGDAPFLFYSRRIGLSGSRAVPILAGGRLSGKVGPWSVGALSIESDDDVTTGPAKTNFSVVRLRRDVLGRSTIGAIVTNRSIATLAPGSASQMWGLDGNFAFRRNIFMSGYIAQTRTDGLDGKDFSHRGQFSYGGDRYGVQVERLAVEDDFNPEVGFLRRENFRSSFAGFRFSPRPKARGTVRQYHFENSIEYITDTQNRLESRELRSNFRTDLQNGDQFGATYTRSLESLVIPFEISTGVWIPTGSYTFDNMRASYNPGPQHRVSGAYTLDVGKFYDGNKSTAAARGRFEVSSRLAFEPNISLNWVNLPQASFTSTVVGTRATMTLTPRAFVAALVQYTSSTTSLLTNVRLRWEYRPGSELFVVYSEGRDTLSPRSALVEHRGIALKLTRLLRF
jgi:hypothetical protein